jgi:hypothetical protein
MKLATVATLVTLGVIVWSVGMLSVGNHISEDSPFWICQLMGNMQCS